MRPPCPRLPAAERMVKLQLENRDIRDARLLEAMRRVPRHLFAPPEARNTAYDDHPVSIGRRQTMSQPYMVAFMTQALELRGPERVLEVGTGQRVPGCRPGRAVLGSLQRRTDPAARRIIAPHPGRTRIRQRARPGGRRERGLARRGAVRSDHRDRGGSHGAGGSLPAARRQRHPRSPRWSPGSSPGAGRRAEDRFGHELPEGYRLPLCSPDRAMGIRRNRAAVLSMR